MWFSLPAINGRHSEPPPTELSTAKQGRQYSTYRVEERSRREPVVMRRSGGGVILQVTALPFDALPLSF